MSARRGSPAGRLLHWATSPRALRLPLLGAALDGAAASTALPEALREPLARDLAASWQADQQPERAERMLRRASAAASDPSTAAILDALALARVLDRGERVADARVRTSSLRCLERADRALEAGDERVVRLLTAAASLTFHPARHLAGLGSPFATPAGVAEELSPHRASTAWQRLTAAGEPSGDRVGALVKPPACVVVLHDDDPRFVQPLIDHWRTTGIEVRLVSPREEAARRRVHLPTTLGELVAARWGHHAAAPWSDLLAELVAGADLVWQEWAQRGAVLSSMAAGPMVVRAHSFELFTAYPHLIDPAGVAGLLAVSPPIEHLARTLLPAWSTTPSAVCGPVVDVERFRDEAKAVGAGRTLGLVGWAAPDKDPVWAIDLLAELRARDAAWRLRLIGPPPDAGRWPAHAARVAERLSRADVAGAVDLVGPTADVPGELRHVGVAVSSSMRESFHVGLAEMVASGARPVVRDWPTLSAYGGARQVWPAEWVVSTIPEAVERLSSGGKFIAKHSESDIVATPPEDLSKILGRLA